MDTTAPLYLFCRQPNERYGDAFYSTEACTQVADGDSSDVDASLKRPYRSLRGGNGTKAGCAGGGDGLPGSETNFNVIKNQLSVCPKGYDPIQGKGKDATSKGEGTTYFFQTGNCIDGKGKNKAPYAVKEEGVYYAAVDDKFRRACAARAWQRTENVAACCMTGASSLPNGVVCKDKDGNPYSDPTSKACSRALSVSLSASDVKSVYEEMNLPPPSDLPSSDQVYLCGLTDNFKTHENCRTWCRSVAEKGDSYCDKAALSYCSSDEQKGKQACRCTHTDPPPGGQLTKLMEAQTRIKRTEAQGENPKQCWWGPCLRPDAILTSEDADRTKCPTSFTICEMSNINIDTACKQAGPDGKDACVKLTQSCGSKKPSSSGKKTSSSSSSGKSSSGLGQTSVNTPIGTFGGTKKTSSSSPPSSPKTKKSSPPKKSSPSSAGSLVDKVKAAIEKATDAIQEDVKKMKR